MCDWTEKKRLKKLFRKEAFRFCQSFWEEQKASQKFTFNEYNKDIIEALKDLSGNKEDIHLMEREELWFFRGMYKEYVETLQLNNPSLNGMKR